MNLQKKVKEILNIILEIEYLKADLLSISNSDTSYYKSVITSSESFTRIYRNSYKLFVIELAKLLDSKEHFCLLSLVNYLLTNEKEIEWKRDFEKSKLIVYRDEILKLEKENLKSIKTLRDKFYAHTDKNRRDHLPVPYSFQKGCEILKQLREIFEDIIFHLNNQKIMFDHILSTLTGEMVILYRYKQIRELIFEKLKESPNLGELQQIRDITIGKPASN